VDEAKTPYKTLFKKLSHNGAKLSNRDAHFVGRKIPHHLAFRVGVISLVTNSVMLKEEGERER
jgi:hypothetical protein